MCLPIVVYLLTALVVGARSADVQCQQPGATIIRRDSLTCGNKQYIVDLHNKIRNTVSAGMIPGQPRAADMLELKWSEPLARLAQKRADSCIFEHGDLQLNGERVGQNLAYQASTGDHLRLNVTFMVDLWYQEVHKFGYNGAYDPQSGHYSQLIWGNTREVGCGFSYYKEDEWYKVYFVCDYYPPGNVLGQLPYTYGKHDCKRFNLKDSRRWSKLCETENLERLVCNKPQDGTTAMEEQFMSTTTPLPEEVFTTEPEDSGETITEEPKPASGQTMVVVPCNGTAPPELSWNNKDEFYSAATKLLDLLVNRKLYFVNRNDIR